VLAFEKRKKKKYLSKSDQKEKISTIEIPKH
jgi:hypothetical protein